MQKESFIRKMTDYSFELSFSVLMAVYKKDSPGLFGRAIKSVFDGSLKPKKLLVVCDGPLTNELESELTYAHKVYGNALKIIRLKKNRGLFCALNEGLKHVETVWTARADADDINRPCRFEMLGKLIRQNPKAVLVGGAIQEKTIDGKNLKVRSPPLSYSEIRAFLKTRNPFNHMTTAFKTSVVRDLGGYPDLYLREDYGLWIKIVAKKYVCVNTAEILVDATTDKDLYRRRGGVRYAKAEFELQRFLNAYGIKSKGKAFLDGTIRAAVFLAPSRIRATIYSYLLRK